LVQVLVEEFKIIAKRSEDIKPKEARIEPWLKTFTYAYFRALPIYESRFKARQKDYLNKLEQRFKDVQFVGMSVRGQEKEKFRQAEPDFCCS
jgi:hypothetical protein